MNDTAVKPESVSEALSLATACDRCGFVESGAAEATFTASPVATAAVLVTFPSGNSLAFCGHHFAASEVGIISAGGIITDDNRDRLTARPESGFGA
jgi:hypothetical protein